MNPYLLEDLMTNFSYILLVFISVLIISLLVLALRSENKARGNRKSLQTLNELESAFYLFPSPAVIINRAGRIVLSNKAALDLFGLTESEVKEEFLDAYTIISSSKKLTLMMKDEIKNKGNFTFTNDIKSHDERLECSFTLIPLSPGNNVEYLVLIEPREDEERREYEQNLLEERLNEVENAAGIGYWIYDYEKAETKWSRGLYKLLAKPINSTKPDLSFLSQFTPEYRKSTENLMIAIKDQKPYYDRVVLRGDDGILRTVDLYLKHQKDLNRDLQRSMGVLREVREYPIGEADELYLNLWTHLITVEDILVAIIDESGKVKFLNDYAQKVFGITLEDVLESRLESFTDERGATPFATFSSDEVFITEINETLIFWQPTVDTVNAEEYLFLTGIDLSDCENIYQDHEKA